MYYCIYKRNNADTEFHLLKLNDLTPVTSSTLVGIKLLALDYAIVDPIYLFDVTNSDDVYPGRIV